MSIDFVEALRTDNLVAIRAAAKTDVHAHIFLSTRRGKYGTLAGTPSHQTTSQNERT